MAKFFENKDISIMCPVCRKFLVKADKRDCSLHKLVCRSCGNWIWFNPKKKKAEVHIVPQRSSGSGMRLY